jgi:hypothetical protein
VVAAASCGVRFAKLLAASKGACSSSQLQQLHSTAWLQQQQRQKGVALVAAAPTGHEPSRVTSSNIWPCLLKFMVG